jgi:PAS domain S-box-containing protein
MGNAVKTKQYPVKKSSRSSTSMPLGAEELKQSLKRLEALIYEAPIGICHTDLTGKFTYANKRFEKVSGYPREEVVGKSGFKLGMFSSQTLKLLRERIKNRLAGRPSRVVETQFKCKDGHWIWVAMEGQLIRERGIPVGFQIIAGDITERKRAEEELLESEERSRSIVENSHDGIMILDDAYRFTYVNDELCRMSGYSREEIIGQDFRKFLDEESKQLVADRYIRRQRGEEVPPRYEFNIVHKDGQKRRVEISSSVIKDSAGNAKTVAQILDITERKQAEEAIRQSEENLQAYLENAPDGVYLNDLKGTFLYGNKKAEELTGYKREELIEKSFLKLNLLPAKYLAKAAKLLALNAMGKSTGPDEFELIRKDGSRIWIEINTTPVKRKGKVVVIGFVRDITARKQAEKQLRQSEEKYSTLVERGNDGIIIIQDALIKFANAKMVETAGLSLDEVVGKPFVHFVPPEYRGLVTEHYEKRVSGAEVPSKYEIEILAKDGGKIPIEINASRIEYEGQPADMAIVRDISERKWAEQNIKQLQDYLQLQIDRMPIGLIVWNTGFQVRDWNPAAEKIFGFMAEEVLGKHPYDFIVPKEAQPHVDDIWSRLLEGDTTAHSINENITKDGRTIICEWTNTPLKKADGTVVGALSMVQDITERKRAEEALADEATRRRILVDQSRDGIVILDNNGKVYETNQRFAEMLGYTPEETTKLHVWDWEYLYPRERVLEMIRTVDEAGDHFETQHRRKDGSVYDVEISTNGAVCAGQKLVFCVCRDITERKQAEEALKESQKFSSSLLESSPNPILVINPDTSVRYVNPAFEKLTGFTLVEIAGRKAPYPWWPEEQREEITAALKNAMAHGGRRTERNFQKKNGERFWVVVNSAPVVREGKPTYFILNWLDITERKWAEEALKESEAKFRSLAEQSPNMIFINKDRRVVYANKRCEEIMAYKKEEFYSPDFDFLTLIAPKSREKVKANFAAHIAAHDVPAYEYSLVTKDGKEIEGILTSKLIDYEGSSAILGIVTDITERKQSEEKIRQAAEEWRTTFDSITDLVSILDKDFSIIRVNKAFANAFKMKPKELLGKSCYEVVHKTDEPLPDCPHRKTLETKRPATLEFFEPNLEIYLEERTSPIFDEKGEIVGSVRVARDVTERKQMQEQLIMTERLASIGELASGIAHELNNPLTSVIGFSQLLMERNTTDDIREDLGLVYSEAQRAAGIVKNLLTFARKHSPVEQLSQINNVIEDVLRLRAYEQRVNNIGVDKRFASDLPEIMVDYFQMQQVFLNIIINAEYFMTQEHNRGTLTITTERFDNIVRISFADDGPGISKENLRRIFNPFFTTKEVGKGTGLGLSICHGIVTGHGGNIYARSRPGKGATFVVELPIDAH